MFSGLFAIGLLAGLALIGGWGYTPEPTSDARDGQAVGVFHLQSRSDFRPFQIGPYLSLWYDSHRWTNHRLCKIGPEIMTVQEGSKILFSRAGRVLEGRVFAVHGGACSVEVSSRRAFYLERWEVLLVLGVDEEYLTWLLDDEPVVTGA